MKKRKVKINRFIETKDGVIGPVKPRLKTSIDKKPEDYPEVSAAHLEIAAHLGPDFFGPPLCDELMSLVLHMYTEDEASIIRHLKPNQPMNAEGIAGASHRPLEEVQKILDRLADELHLIISFGPLYLLLPILPGVFELALVRQSKDTLTDWHRRFAELFEALWESGSYMVDRDKVAEKALGVRFLPSQAIMKTHPMALPSDMLEVVLEPYSLFAVGLCQCRLTTDIVGQGCGRPMDVCTAMGSLANMAIDAGVMRRVEKKELIEIKLEAEAAGLVNWIQTQAPLPGSNTMCSCCGCCCHAMRSISEFNMPGIIAPPHFMPQIDDEKCDYCGKCARKCPMGAITIDTKGKKSSFEPLRCVGCGQCFIACDKKKAVELKPVKDYIPPPII